VAIFKNKEPIYYIHWDFERFFLMVDSDERVITTSGYQNATELIGRSMAVKTLRTLNNLKAQELGHADIANIEVLTAREKGENPENETVSESDMGMDSTADVSE